MNRPLLKAFLSLASAIAGCLGVFPCPALAGSYVVTACSPTTSPGLWAQTNTFPAALTTGNQCGGPAIGPLDGSHTGALYAEDILNSPENIPDGARAGWTFTAPAGTTITAISYYRSLSGYNNWNMPAGLYTADGSALEECRIPWPFVPPATNHCDKPNNQVPVTFTGLTTSSLFLGIKCQLVTGAIACNRGHDPRRESGSVLGARDVVGERRAGAERRGRSSVGGRHGHGRRPRHVRRDGRQRHPAAARAQRHRANDRLRHQRVRLRARATLPAAAERIAEHRHAPRRRRTAHLQPRRHRRGWQQPDRHVTRRPSQKRTCGPATTAPPARIDNHHQAAEDQDHRGDQEGQAARQRLDHTQQGASESAGAPRRATTAPSRTDRASHIRNHKLTVTFTLGRRARSGTTRIAIRSDGASSLRPALTAANRAQDANAARWRGRSIPFPNTVRNPSPSAPGGSSAVGRGCMDADAATTSEAWTQVGRWSVRAKPPSSRRSDPGLFRPGP